MTEKSKYIAITIGPVFDTINLASSPCALWAGSYMLSMLSKNICIVLTEKGIKAEDIISPSFNPDDKLLNRNDGVGLFHDRVIFKIDETKFTIEDFSKVKQEAIERTVTMFGFGEKRFDYFKKYFLVSAVKFESEYVTEDKDKGIEAHNPILDSSVALDCLELAKPFQKQNGKNPLLTFYTADNQEHHNQQILQQVKILKLTQWQLYKNNKQGIRTLEDVASGKISEELKKKFKKYNYYAVVRSDGDRIGKIISSLGSDEDVRKFSHICLKYCSKVADMVRNQYDGITIYSGGDDLLALIPVEERNGKTIFHFVKETNQVFIDSFAEYKIDVSLSFGIFVSYYKFPLYEALEQSAYLLFDVAKSRRNALAIHFQKHSGQSAGLLIDNVSLEELIHFYDGIGKQKVIDIKEQDRIFVSAMQKFMLFADIFNTESTMEEVRNVFKNIFDADIHKNNVFLKETLPDFFLKLKDNLSVFPIKNDGLEIEKSRDYATTMVYILRVIKFFSESAGERE